MGKQNNNFEYYKPQNGSSLLPSAEESESGDSDTKAMFQLPKRKIFRARGGFNKTRSGRCCQVCCGSVVPLVVSIFIIGTLASIGYILLGVNGMRREMELFKIQMNKVQSEEKSNLKESKHLQQRVEKQLKSSSKAEAFEKLNAKVALLNKQVKILNATIAQLKSKSDSPKGSDSSSIAEDVTLLKKGMADTGGEIKKLTDDNAEAKKTIRLLTKIIKGMKQKYVNLTNTMAKISRNPLPTEPVDTLEPLVVTTAPTENNGNNIESLGKVSKLLRKVLKGYNELYKNKTENLTFELMKLNVKITQLNSTHGNSIAKLSKAVSQLQNLTETHEQRLAEISTKLLLSVGTHGSSAQESRLFGVVKDILMGMKNLTEKVKHLDSLVPSKWPRGSTPTTEAPTTLYVNMGEVNDSSSTQTHSAEAQINGTAQVVDQSSSISLARTAIPTAPGNYSAPIVTTNSSRLVNSTDPTKHSHIVLSSTVVPALTSVVPVALNTKEESPTASEDIELENLKGASTDAEAIKEGSTAPTATKMDSPEEDAEGVKSKRDRIKSALDVLKRTSGRKNAKGRIPTPPEENYESPRQKFIRRKFVDAEGEKERDDQDFPGESNEELQSLDDAA